MLVHWNNNLDSLVSWKSQKGELTKSSIQRYEPVFSNLELKHIFALIAVGFLAKAPQPPGGL